MARLGAASAAGNRRSLGRRPVFWVSVLVLLLMAIFVPPYVSLNRYKQQMIESISRSLGRPVHIDGMHLRLLPTPGIVMNGFEVEEDPGFGAEPALRAPSVVATLRVSSLWRRPIEVSSISMDEPSLNLVRSPGGQWNVSSILLQAARAANAPTTQANHTSTPRFPYIEFSGARINLKSGLEKRPFSLLNTDLAIWQDTPNEWRIRLKGQPVRTDLDLDLSDTGVVRLEGSLGRTTDLSSMPVRLEGSWEDAQLGQATRLVLGTDEGWRGELGLSASFRGTLRTLHVRWAVRLPNPYRQEFTPVSSPGLDASCQATYHSGSHAVDGLLCLLPTPPGHLLLTGNIPDLQAPAPSLQLEVNQVPAPFLVQLIGLVRQRAGSLRAQGSMNGQFGYGSAADAAPVWSGSATIAPLTLALSGLPAPLVIPRLTLSTVDFGDSAPPVRKSRTKPVTHLLGNQAPSDPPVFGLNILPAEIPLGGSEPLAVGGRLDAAGFHLQLAGDASVADLLALHEQLGSPAVALDGLGSMGTAELNLTVGGPWVASVDDAGTPRSTRASGSMQLSNVALRSAFLTEQAVISSAEVTLSPDEVTWNDAAFTLGALSGHVSASYPADCAPPARCQSHFTLEIPRADTAQLVAAFTGSDAHGVLWQDLLAHFDRGHRMWPSATGAVRIGTLTVGPMTLHKLLANVSLAGTYLQIQSLDATALGAEVHAQGSIDAEGNSPRWNLTVAAQNLAVTDLAALFHEHWGSGTGSVQAQWSMQGWDAPALADSAAGSFHFSWQKGTLAGAGPLEQFAQWTAQGRIAQRSLILSTGMLQPRAKAVPEPVTGSIGFDRKFHLTVGSGDGAPPVSDTPAASVK